MRLREIAVYADKELVENYKGGFVTRFHQQTLCVTTSLMHALGDGLSSGQVNKVLINAFDNAREESHDFPMNVWLRFDFAHYQNALNSEKRRMIADLTRAGLDHVARYAPWDAKVIDEAFTAASSYDFVICRPIRKKWLSPNRRLRAEVLVTWDLDAVRFEAIISHRVGNKYVPRDPVEIGTIIPSDGCVTAYAEGARWLNDETFCLESSAYWTDRLTLHL